MVGRFVIPSEVTARFAQHGSQSAVLLRQSSQDCVVRVGHAPRNERRRRPTAGCVASLEVLADPLADPMAPEWIVVTTAGVQRWLGLELARRLGASDALTAPTVWPPTWTCSSPAPSPDGCSSPRHRSAQNDPWHLDRVAWVVLDVLESDGHGHRPAARTPQPPGPRRHAVGPRPATGRPIRSLPTPSSVHARPVDNRPRRRWRQHAVARPDGLATPPVATHPRPHRCSQPSRTP